MVGSHYGYKALEVGEESAQTIVGMDEVRALDANHAAQGRQLAQIAGDAFTSDAVADDRHAAGLKGGHLLFDEGSEFATFVGCDYEDFHFRVYGYISLPYGQKS